MTTFSVVTCILLFPACVEALLSSSNRPAARRALSVRPPKFDTDATKVHKVTSFGRTRIHRIARRRPSLFTSSETGSDVDTQTSTSSLLDPDISCKFKILTCSSTSCAKKRRDCGLDEFATYGAFYSLIQQNAPDVQLEESPCLGSCQMAPCVGIEHDDFEGTVALEGMHGNEFTERIFHNILEDDDVERVWECVENAIEQMAKEEKEDDDDDVNGGWI